MEIALENLQKKISLNLPRIEQASRLILKHECRDPVELTIVFVSAQRITALNKKYLHRAYGTDVLAFDLTDPFSSKTALIGDIFISTDAVLQNSRRFASPVARELALYISHGILHLIGYDDHSSVDTARMRAREEEHLKRLQRMIPTLIRA